MGEIARGLCLLLFRVLDVGSAAGPLSRGSIRAPPVSRKKNWTLAYEAARKDSQRGALYPGSVAGPRLEPKGDTLFRDLGGGHICKIAFGLFPGGKVLGIRTTPIMLFSPPLP